MSDRVKIVLDVPRDFALHLAGALEVGADSGDPEADSHVSDIAEQVTDLANNPTTDSFEFVIH